MPKNVLLFREKCSKRAISTISISNLKHSLVAIYNRQHYQATRYYLYKPIPLQKCSRPPSLENPCLDKLKKRDCLIINKKFPSDLLSKFGSIQALFQQY